MVRTVLVADAVHWLATYPGLGRVGRKEGTRELVVPKTPYIVVYRIELGEVVILRLLHGAQDWLGGGSAAEALL